MTTDAQAGAVLTVDLDAVAANWRLLRDRLGGAECGAVVKADGYGLGMAPVARALAAAGCRSFFVAHAEEGIALRETLPDAAIYVMHGVARGEEAEMAARALVPVANTPDEVARLAAFARAPRSAGGRRDPHRHRHVAPRARGRRRRAPRRRSGRAGGPRAAPRPQPPRLRGGARQPAGRDASCAASRRCAPTCPLRRRPSPTRRRYSSARNTGSTWPGRAPRSTAWRRSNPPPIRWLKSLS